MAVAFVKNVGSANASMATTATVTVPVAGCASGNFLVIRLVYDTGGTFTISDTGSHTWTEHRENVQLGASGDFIGAAVVTLTTGLVSGDTIVATFSTKVTGSIVVDEWSGVGSQDTIGTDGTGTSTTPSGNVTPAAAGLVVGFVYSANTNSISTEDSDSNGGDTWHALTGVGSGRSSHAAYKIATSATTQTYDPTLGTSAVWRDFVGTWQAAAAGHTATGALTLPAVTVSGTGAEVFTATGAVVLPSTTVAGTGHHPHIGTGALSLPTVTVSGTGQEVFTSTGALTTEPIVIAGAGTHTNEKIGTGALTLPSVTVAGTGEEVFTSTGAVALSAVTVAGTGSEVFTSTGALTLAAPTLDGTGALLITGTGALELAALAVAGVGDSGTEPEPEPEPTGAQYYRVERLRKPARQLITGTGAIVLPMPTVAGRGQSFDNDFRLLMDPELVLAGAI